jgi:hypothetical protein
MDHPSRSEETSHELALRAQSHMEIRSESQFMASFLGCIPSRSQYWRPLPHTFTGYARPDRTSVPISPEIWYWMELPPPYHMYTNTHLQIGLPSLQHWSLVLRYTLYPRNVYCVFTTWYIVVSTCERPCECSRCHPPRRVFRQAASRNIPSGIDLYSLPQHIRPICDKGFPPLSEQIWHVGTDWKDPPCKHPSHFALIDLLVIYRALQ